MLKQCEPMNREQFAAMLHMAHMPSVSLGGTSPDQLLSQRVEVMHTLWDAWRALQAAAPNGRDYVDASHLRAAQRAHQLRMDVLKAMMDSLELEIEWVSDSVSVG